MNRTFVILTGILLLSNAAKTQSHFGLKGGVNLANEVKKEHATISAITEPFIGYQFGVFYKAMLHESLLLSAEANFSVIGCGITLVSSSEISYHAHEKLGYIELPFILEYEIAKFYFGAGPSIAFKVFSKITKFENRSFNTSFYKTTDAAGNIVAGYSLSKILDVNLRYSYGLVNLYKDPANGEARNKFWNLSLLYALK